MTSFQRFYYSLVLMLLPNAKKRTEFLRKKKLFGHIGEKCSIQKRKVPLHSKLIYLHNNVKVASNVGFVTHDIIHKMLNDCDLESKGKFMERVGCIEIMDNVFIGSGTRILYGVRIGTNVIIGSDSLVNKDVPDNSVYAGVPARYICSFDEYVKKAEAYSEDFRKKYGVTKIKGISNTMAEALYKDFCKQREKAME